MKEISLQNLKKLINKKRVALVGPAEYVMKELGEEHGKFIDSFDVVIKLNNMINHQSELNKYYGSRCDILISSFYLSKLDGHKNKHHFEIEENYKSKQNMVLFENMPRFLFREVYKSFKEPIEDNYSYYCIEEEFHNKSLKTLSSLSDITLEKNKAYTTGLLAISNILNMKPKKLYISGITSYLDTKHNGYYEWYSTQNKTGITNYFDGKDYPSGKTSGHNFNVEKIIFKNIIKSNKKVKTDVYLKTLLN